MERFADLISDTTTLPSREMLETILTAPLGDAGRLGPDKRGEDITTNRLEDMAAAITGKEAALYFPTGTIANTTGILSWVRAGSKILTEEKQHIMRTEKICYMEDGFRMVPVIYRLKEDRTYDLEAVEKALKEGGIGLALIENSHNFTGGMAIGLDQMKAFYDLCHKYGVPVHMDGARLFNAAEALGCSAADICQYTDTVMFCISKGLGAPVGSLLCGPAENIKKGTEIRSILGGTMRQSGIGAACGIYALEHNVERLKEDRENCQLLYKLVKGKLKVIDVDPYPDTNILLVDFGKTGLAKEEFDRLCKAKGFRGYFVSDTIYRLVFHLGITRDDAEFVAEKVLELDKELAR